MFIICIFFFSCSFLDEVGSEESSCVPSSPPAALEPSSSEADVPTVRHTNITDLINESYTVRRALNDFFIVKALHPLLTCNLWRMRSLY